MKRTHATPLIGLGLLGLVIGFLLEIGAVASGSAIIVPPASLPLTLAVMAVIVVSLAWRVRRSIRRRGTRRVDPFWAMRVAVLSKASSLSGAVLLGTALGIVTYILTRTVVAALPSLWLTITAGIGALLLLVGGLVAEYFCTLPPDDDEQNRDKLSGDVPGGQRV
ncbi:DUF3180 domain-containing protein [Cryobacterium psychrophilum]|uniref:DUF3180 domain-containing protein n=1 Tax=Cryobacterium psychrophilum TaxID=41988 RepID=A0A4Y8KMX7_9MICO|nr:DUF3180 domain-containing protein [Cryobacterium psychrophilum]TDW29916.1 uncharacterized protein DUF3180 [Cryobacterium psychrophilum]TFD76481.1 DUF3180 domain-containing protein [Cryobacterium psychrophilum]